MSWLRIDWSGPYTVNPAALNGVLFNEWLRKMMEKSKEEIRSSIFRMLDQAEGES